MQITRSSVDTQKGRTLLGSIESPDSASVHQELIS